MYFSNQRKLCSLCNPMVSVVPSVDISWSQCMTGCFHSFLFRTGLPIKALICRVCCGRPVEAADKGCWKAFVPHSFTCWEPFCIFLKSKDLIAFDPKFVEWPYWGSWGDELHSRGLLGENKMAVCDMRLCWQARDVSHGHQGVRTGYL